MKFLYLTVLLFSFQTFAKPCGLTGSIEERIKECAVTKDNFVLVAATEKGQEFYKDTKSNLIWGNRIPIDFNHFGSQKACSKGVSGYEVLDSLNWRLPTIREFEVAAANGMKASLSGMEYTYWSSTPVKRSRSWKRRKEPAQVFLWDSPEERTSTGDLKEAASVRCVVKAPK
jgi:hypothetical protein